MVSFNEYQENGQHQFTNLSIKSQGGVHNNPTNILSHSNMKSVKSGAELYSAGHLGAGSHKRVTTADHV